MVQGTPLGSGVFVPIPSFFKPETEDLDLEALEKHVKYMCNTGIAGIIFMGSTGEAVHLSDEERITSITKGREFIQKYDPSVKVLAGCGTQSARGTIKLAKDAAQAGAEYVLVLPPSYYKPSMTSDALYEFFKRVADESPVPVVIYNYPGVTQGVDVDVETIVKLAKHPNIVGIKGTDGNIGKVGYVAHRITPEGKITIITFYLRGIGKEKKMKSGRKYLIRKNENSVENGNFVNDTKENDCETYPLFMNIILCV